MQQNGSDAQPKNGSNAQLKLMLYMHTCNILSKPEEQLLSGEQHLSEPH